MMKSLKKSLAPIALTTLISGVGNSIASDNNECKPEYEGVIPAVQVEVSYTDGLSETVDLWTERRTYGRDTGILINDGKRVMPFERNDVLSARFTFPKNKLYDGKDGILMEGTALIDGEEIDISDLLVDSYLSPQEISDLGGELNGSWQASKFKDGKRIASLEGKIDLDKSKVIEVPGPVTTVTDTLFAKPDTVYANLSEKEVEFYSLIGLTSGPTAKDGRTGPEYTLGVDNVAGTKFGLYANVGGLPKSSELVDEHHLVEYLGNNRRHIFDKEVIDENEDMTKVGAGLAYELFNNLRIQFGAGMFLGNRRELENRSIGITDLDGNYIGVDNPVSESSVNSEHKSEPYWSLGGRADLGKWQIDAKYHREVDTKGNGFSVGLGRKF